MSLENNSGPVREDYRPTDPVDAAHYTAARKFSSRRVSINGVVEITMDPGEVAYGSRDVFTIPEPGAENSKTI